MTDYQAGPEGGEYLYPRCGDPAPPALRLWRIAETLSPVHKEIEMNGDDITDYNLSIPIWPSNMPLWQRVLCLFGYHKRETRQTGPTNKFPGTKLRDQCGRCNTLL